MDYQTLDPAILAALPKNSELLSVTQHGSTNWSTGLRVNVLDGDDEKSYFLKIIEREELVGMAEAEYEGQKTIASLIPNNAVKPFAWGYFAETRSKAWFLAVFSNLQARAPPLDRFLPIVKQMHQTSVSPTGKFGFHVTSFFGPPPMIVDWTDNWEEFWVREFRSGLRYVESKRGQDAELVCLGEEFIQKVASRLLRPLQTGGRNIKPSLCHGDLWDENIQYDVDSQEPVIFDPCCFYGHHEMDFQSMRSPRYVVGREFINLYKDKVGASEPTDDFEDRIALYAVRNDLITAAVSPQWISLIDEAKDEMRRLIEKYPNGLDSFQGSLEPTLPKVEPALPAEIVVGGENIIGCDYESDGSAIVIALTDEKTKDDSPGGNQLQSASPKPSPAVTPNPEPNADNKATLRASNSSPDVALTILWTKQNVETEGNHTPGTALDSPKDLAYAVGGDDKLPNEVEFEPSTWPSGNTETEIGHCPGNLDAAAKDLCLDTSQTKPPHAGAAAMSEASASVAPLKDDIHNQQTRPKINELPLEDIISMDYSEYTLSNSPDRQRGRYRARLSPRLRAVLRVRRLFKSDSASDTGPTELKFPFNAEETKAQAQNSVKNLKPEMELATWQAAQTRRMRLPSERIAAKVSLSTLN